jgi:biotin operon repressor
MALPRRYQEFLDARAQELGTSRDRLLRAVVDEHFGLTPDALADGPGLRGTPLPAGYHEPSRRVYSGLHELGGAATCEEIGDHIGLHPGNVAKHIRRLRDDGFVRRDEQRGRGVHSVVTASDRREDIAS